MGVGLKTVAMSQPSGPNRGVSIYMVFEYLEHDLVGIMINPSFKGFTIPQIKYYAWQLCDGLYHMHTNNVLHRDVKGANLLIGLNHELKIADFGLSRPCREGRAPYTMTVQTQWYKAPEVMLGDCHYTSAIDMWSAGCIIAEMFFRRAVLPGEDDKKQLAKIFDLVGTPTPESYEGLERLPVWKHSEWPFRKGNIDHVFRHFPPLAVNLIKGLLTLDPKKRLTAEQALEHDLFWEPDFLGGDSEEFKIDTLPKYNIPCHELQAKKRRQESKQRNGQGGGGGGGHHHHHHGHQKRPHHGHGHHNHNNHHQKQQQQQQQPK